MENSTYAKESAARLLGVSGPTVAKMIALEKLDAHEGKPLRTAVKQLVEQASRRQYCSGNGGKHMVFACPVTSLDLGGNFYLEEKSYSIDGEEIALHHPSPPYRLTGFWEISDKNTEELVSSQGILLGVTGGFVFEAAKVIELSLMIQWRKRKVFVVEPLRGSDLEPYLGFVPGMQQIPRLVH